MPAGVFSSLYFNTPRAGAADAQFVFVFRIEVEQDAAFEHLGIELVRAGHARFLIHRDQDFQGGVFHVVGREDGQCSGYSDTVVGSQGRSFGTYPLAVHYAADAFGIEVELRVGILLVYHVHVSLEDDDGRIFLARGGRFAENDVAHLIDGGIYLVFFSEFLEKFYGFGFLLRAARHGIEVLEIVPYRFGLEGTYVFTHSVLFFGYRFCDLHLPNISFSYDIFSIGGGKIRRLFPGKNFEKKCGGRTCAIKIMAYICNRKAVLCIRANTRVAKWGRL